MARDRGSATVEFVALTLILLVPVLYLGVSMARVQAGAFAAEAAAYSAGRAAVVAGLASLDAGASDANARAAAADAARLAATTTAEDFGFPPDAAEVTVTCGDECLAPGTAVTAQVSIEVDLPGVPDAITAHLPLGVDLQAAAMSPVDGQAP